jgi:ribosomal protein L32
MALRQHRSMTVLDRLRARYDLTERVCPDCGHEDADGGWEDTTDGRRVRFRRVCPACDAVTRPVARLGRDDRP